VAASISEKIPRERIDVRKIENDLKQYGVKLVLAAHDHVYERIKPQHGIAHYVAGAGSELRENDLDGRLPSFHGCGEARKNSFMLFSVKPGSVSFWTIDLNGVVFDSGVLNP